METVLAKNPVKKYNSREQWGRNNNNKWKNDGKMLFVIVIVIVIINSLNWDEITLSI